MLDLFAGCGGLSLGFLRAGFEITGAIEFDPLAAQSHAVNFYRTAAPFAREPHARPYDITAIEPAQFLGEIGVQGRTDTAIDVVIGGPPCQAFARVGRAKLREVAEHPDAFKLDPRGNLYLRYLHFVKELRPLAILMENVPDAMNYGGHNVAEETADVLASLGYVCRYTLLNAVHYGVPEMRERMFLVAYREELGGVPQFPAPTHRLELPRGYHNSRQVALKTVNDDLFGERRFYTLPPSPNGAKLRPAVTAKEALRDLPPITEHLEGRAKRGARRFDEFRPYAVNKGISEFANEMRKWPGFMGNGGVSDHVIRSLPRDYPIFRRMNPGDQYPEAYQHALDMFQERLVDLQRNGHAVRVNSQEYKDLMSDIVPPYDSTKFPNKWRKMEADFPARTLMAHLGKDSYSHIHYDSEQARTISVREAARLQSFPDGYLFSGTMNPAFRQIGNAVPPLLSYRIALTMLSGLGIPP
ncbi:MAG: DNA cytosine methyltransferase [Betaproteobacteria bacterium]